MGAKLVLSARSEDKLKAVKKRCIQDAGRYHDLTENDILVLPFDMTDLNCHENAFKKGRCVT